MQGSLWGEVQYSIRERGLKDWLDEMYKTCQKIIIRKTTENNYKGGRTGNASMVERWGKGCNGEEKEMTNKRRWE